MRATRVPSGRLVAGALPGASPPGFTRRVLAMSVHSWQYDPSSTKTLLRDPCPSWLLLSDRWGKERQSDINYQDILVYWIANTQNMLNQSGQKGSQVHKPVLI